MTGKKRSIVILLIATIILGGCCSLIANFGERYGDELESKSASVIYAAENKDDEINQKASKVITNSTVSVFSWHFELTDPAKSDEYVDVLKKLNVTRIYQNVSEKVMSDSEIRYQICNLADRGIETVALTGDKSWVNDGLKEYKSIIDSIVRYNESVNKKLRIKAIALDVESHLLPEWKNNKTKVFKKYINVMSEAKEYANERNLKVIQVIPTYYDNVNKTLFNKFLEKCCDEISIMNYDIKNSGRAIKYEVEACAKKKIPVETIFETMPISDEHGVEEGTTYYYKGFNALKKGAKSLKKAYGSSLGVAYHQFTTLYELIGGDRIGEVWLSSSSEMESERAPGLLILYGDDGSVLEATPYWPKGRKSSDGYRYLLNGAQSGVTYKVEYYDMKDEEILAESACFNQEEGSMLVMDLTDSK